MAQWWNLFNIAYCIVPYQSNSVTEKPSSILAWCKRREEGRSISKRSIWILLTTYFYFFHSRVPPRGLDRVWRQERGYVADSCWTATATAPAGRTGVVAGGGGRVRVCEHATPPGAARGARHAGVRRGVQRAAAQRFGLLRGHFLSGGGRLPRHTEKEIVAAK